MEKNDIGIIHGTEYRAMTKKLLKDHCQAAVTCALKNHKGVIPNSGKRRFYTLGLHKPTAHLNPIARTDFIPVDMVKFLEEHWVRKPET